VHLFDYLLNELYTDEDGKTKPIPDEIVEFCKASRKVIDKNPPTNLAYEAAGFSLVLSDHTKVTFFDNPEIFEPKYPQPVNMFNAPESPKGPTRNPPSISLFG
jgi:hypothetical protein